MKQENDSKKDELSKQALSSDITERKRSEESLSRLAAIVESSQDAIVSQDLSGTITSWNHGAETIFGYSAEEIIGQPILQLIPPARHREEHDILARVARGEGVRHFETVRLRKDGSTVEVSITVSPIKDASGTIVGISKVARDITARKNTDELLRKSEQRLDLGGKVAGLALAEIDYSTNLSRLSAAASQQFGLGEGEMVVPREQVHSTFHPDDRAELMIAIAASLDPAGEGWFAKDHRVIWPSGEVRWLRVRKQVFFDGEGDVRRPTHAILATFDITSEKLVEERLRLFEKVIERISDVVIVTDAEPIDHPGPRIVYVNPAFSMMTGYTSDEVIGKSPRFLQGPNSNRAELDKVRDALNKWQPITAEVTNYRKDGTEFDVEFSIVPVANAHGLFTNWVSLQRNITVRKRFEESLRQNAALFSSLIAQAPMGTYVVNAEFRMVQVNAEAMPVFATVQPLIGRDFQEVLNILWGPEVGGQIAGIFRHTLTTGERYISTLFTENRHDLGIEQTFEWQTQRMTLPDGQHGVVCYFHEVTDRAQAVAALKASEQRMRLATEATRVGIWEWNLLTNQVRWDAEMFRIYGIAPTADGFVDYSDWCGAVLPENLAENEAILQDTVRQCGQSERTFRIHRRDDGECRSITAVETVRANAMGQAEWVVGTNLDITERERAEKELRRLTSELYNADRRKDEFLATLAHELRNPLAPIRNGLEIMAMSHDDGENFAQVRTMMQRQVVQMVHLVDDLLDVSRISRGKLVLRKQRIELADVVNHAVETSRPLIEANAHELTVIMPNDPVFLEADETRLGQVISNLLNNAAKYSPRGARTWLTAEVQNDYVVVSVKDTGIGIPADMLPKIFDMFTQVDRSLEKSQGGLGIGLCLVKRLVELHGGSVEVKSEGQDKGSEFTVRLPILPSQEYTQSQDAHVILKECGKKRILIVDDNLDSALSLSMMLTLKGHETKTAHDGLAAVQAAEQFRPEIVLLDIGLPKMNGYDVCRCIREQPWSQGMTIVAVTGWGQDEDRRRSSEAGFNLHLVKPINLTSLDQLLAGIDTPIPSLETRKVNRDSLRILVVDDMRDARHMLSTLLKKSGHDVRTASDGPTAIASAMEFQPDAVLMDNSMPGMSGLEVARLLRLEPKLKGVFLIALTGHGDDTDRQESLEAGFNHHLVKPADIKVILELLGGFTSSSK